VVARIVDDALCFDPRTVLPEQDDTLLDAVVAARQGLAAPQLPVACG
jgi:hypothetical protein